MSLIAWYPLNGDTKNYGISEFSDGQILNGLSTSSNGKIGSTYTWTTDGQAIKIAGGMNLLKSLTEYSMMCWIYITANPTGHSITFISSGDWNDEKGQLCFAYYRDRNSILYPNTDSWTFGCDMTSPLIYNEWNHIAITYDGTITRLYINGQYITAENHGGICQESNSSDFYIGAATYYNGFTHKGMLNDVRIYDECLSAREIKEISKALILHYPMNEPDGIIGGRNFILTSNQITSGGNASGITSSYESNGILKIIAAVGNSNYRSIGFLNNSASLVGENLHKGDPYTISFDLYIEAGSGIPKLFINSGNSYASMTGNSTLLGCWQRVYRTGIWNEPGTGYGNIALHLGFSGLAGTYYVKNFKLEKGHNSNCYWSPAPEDSTVFGFDPIIYDSSEYENNGFVTFDSRNLISSTLIAGGQTTLNGNYSVITSGTNADTYFYCNTTEPVNTSDYYEFSYDITCATEIPEGWVFGVNDQNLGNNIPIKVGHQKIIFKFDTAKSQFILDDTGSRPNPTPVVTITNVSLRRLGSAPAWSEEAPLGYGSYKFNGYNYIDCGLTPKLKEFTINFWIKSASLVNGKDIVCCADFGGWEIWPINSNLAFSAYCGGSYRHITIAPLSSLNDDNFHMLSISYCVDEVKTYVDGQLTNAVNMASFGEVTYNSTNHLFLGGEAEGLNCIPKYIGLLNDFRIYATVLSVEDIKELYQTRFSLADNGTLFANNYIEWGENLIEETNEALMSKTWGNMVYQYSQQNCQCSLVDEGFRVYRPANFIDSWSSGPRQTFGGVILRIIDKLKEGHTYILMYHLKGKSSNHIAQHGFSNNAGWSDGGLQAYPSNIEENIIPINFNGEMEGYYKFTINDALYKTCTESYDTFVSGQVYPSYRDFSICWSYENTGPMGTDIIFNNFRLYDITGLDIKQQFNSNGTLNALSLVESGNKLSIHKNGDITATKFN